MIFWIAHLANCLHNLGSTIVRMYPIHILLYLAVGKLLIYPETQNGDAHDYRNNVFFIGR